MVACPDAHHDAYVASVTDVLSRPIVGQRASALLRTDLTLDVLEHAVSGRDTDEPLIRHRDLGAHHLSIGYTERLADADIEPSVGSGGRSDDRALAETIIGLCETDMIHHDGPRRGLEHVVLAIPEGVSWFTTVRSQAALGCLPRAESATQCHASTSDLAELVLK